MRLDIFLSENGFFKSRSKAASAVKSGLVTVNGRVVKPSDEVRGDEAIIAVNPEKYVSRAGDKLEHALKTFGIDVTGMCALDVGASTGGFTDCLLQNGASFVYALDVGRDQLDEGLKNDPRVRMLEGFNARGAKKSDFDREIDLITLDVSFISQALIYPACGDILGKGKKLITLIKPQFEAGRGNVGKGGIVRDRDGGIIKEIMRRLDLCASENGFVRLDFTTSPIEGGDGNTEYLALFEKKD